MKKKISMIETYARFMLEVKRGFVKQNSIINK